MTGGEGAVGAGVGLLVGNRVGLMVGTSVVGIIVGDDVGFGVAGQMASRAVSIDSASHSRRGGTPSPHSQLTILNSNVPPTQIKFWAIQIG